MDIDVWQEREKQKERDRKGKGKEVGGGDGLGTGGTADAGKGKGKGKEKAPPKKRGKTDEEKVSSFFCRGRVGDASGGGGKGRRELTLFSLGFISALLFYFFIFFRLKHSLRRLGRRPRRLLKESRQR